jgi:hypothetical protein
MMRLALSRAAGVLAAALALAACGAPHAAPPHVAGHLTLSAAGQNGRAAFITRARQVTAQWERSAAARAWRTGLVLLQASDLTPVPSDQGFSSQDEKDAFGAGHFRLAGPLPARPLTGQVRWAGGATLGLPLLTARAAFAELDAQRSCGPVPCGQLTVTGARPGAVTVHTSRGLARVPAWQFTVAGLGWPAREVAVARSAMVVLPGVFGVIPPAGRNTPGVDELTAVSANGRTLTLSFPGSACDAAWGAYRYQSGGTVVVGSWERFSTRTTGCEAGVSRTVRVRLARPLGSRVVLDVESGAPLVPGFPILW